MNSITSFALDRMTVKQRRTSMNEGKKAQRTQMKRTAVVGSNRPTSFNQVAESNMSECIGELILLELINNSRGRHKGNLHQDVVRKCDIYKHKPRQLQIRFPFKYGLHRAVILYTQKS